MPGLTVQSTGAVLKAFWASGIRSGNAYNAGASRLANIEPVSIDALSRQIDVLSQLGFDVTTFVGQLETADNLYKVWGSLPGYDSSPADTALALSALLDAHWWSYSNNELASALCAAILPAQGSSGGWSYQVPIVSAPTTATKESIIPTALAVQLLQKAKTTRFTGETCGGTSYTFSNVITRGINFLLTKKNADNGFGDNGTSGVLETALVYSAIEAVNPGDANLGSAQDYLIAAQQADGSWAEDPFQTALALQTLPTVTLADSAGDGIPDVVKARLGISTPADGRGLKPGNGQSVPGSTTSVLLGTATSASPFTSSLAATGGTPPYTYSLVSGQLPDGLTLAADGTISGTPLAAGLFNFTYEVRDANNAVTDTAGQIAVNVADNFDSDVPTLPQWALMVFVSLLLGSLILRDRRPTPSL